MLSIFLFYFILCFLLHSLVNAGVFLLSKNKKQLTNNKEWQRSAINDW